MDSERWRRVEELYHRVLEKSLAERPTFLDEACAGDAELRSEVESLLSFETKADGSLQAAVREAARDVPGLVSGTQPMLAKMGRYQLAERIGKGGMGVVYRAVDPAIGRTVAIKTIAISVDSEQSAELRARLLRESQAGGRLSHPNIVAVHDVCQEGETAYIVMEYVQGRTLSQLMQENGFQMSSIEATRIVRDCAAALDYAHGNGVVHRDVKPSNIMLQTGGAVKIADFGIARVAESPALTKSSAAIGSPEYMAPEQWRGEQATGRTDQYALATVAYTMLAGRRPFAGDSVASLAASTLHENPPAATTFNTRLGSTVDKVLQKALAKDPAERYPTCSEFAAALETAVQTPPVVVAKRSRWIQQAIGAVMLVAVLSVSAWMLLHKTPETRNTQPTITQSASQQPTSQPEPQPAQKDTSPVPKKRISSPVSTHPPVTKTPQDWEAQGETQVKEGNYHEAVDSFTRALAVSPDYRPYFNRASAYQHLGACNKAVDDYSQALRYKPESALAFHDRALCEMRLDRIEDASRDYDQALKLQPDNPRSWNARGEIYLKQHSYSQAIDCFTKAIQLDPKFTQAYEHKAAAEKALASRAHP